MQKKLPPPSCFPDERPSGPAGECYTLGIAPVCHHKHPELELWQYNWGSQIRWPWVTSLKLFCLFMSPKLLRGKQHCGGIVQQTTVGSAFQSLLAATGKHFRENCKSKAVHPEKNPVVLVTTTIRRDTLTLAVSGNCCRSGGPSNFVQAVLYDTD